MNVLIQMYPGDTWLFLVAKVLVQITAVILTAWFVARLGGRWNAAWRHSVYLIALACVLASPLLSWGTPATGVALVTLRSSTPTARPAEPARIPAVRIPEARPFETPALPQMAESPVRREAESTENSAISALSRPPENTSALSLSDILRVLGGTALAVWMLGIVWLAARWRHGSRLISALRRAAQPLDCDAAAEMLGQVRRALGADRLPPIATSAGLDRPIMVGLVRPLVILPEDVLQTLREPELVDVLVHECAHAVCRHHLVGLLQRLAGILFWPHPLVHLLNRELARSREEVCDNYVLRRNAAPRYARTLLELSQSLAGVSPNSTAIGLFHCRWRLEDRVADLLDRRRRAMIRANPWSTGVLAAAFLAVALPIASVRAVQADPKPAAEPAQAADGAKFDPKDKTATFRGKTLRRWALLSRSDDEAVEEEASNALRAALPEAMPAMIEMLKDDDAGVRSAAVCALQEMGSAAKPAVPTIVEMLKRQKTARSPMAPQAGSSLRCIIGFKTTIPKPLLDLLKDEDAGVRRGAAFAVGSLVRSFPDEERTKDDPSGYYAVVDAAAAVPILKELIKDRDSGVRGAAAGVLLEMSPESKLTVVPVLVELLSDKDPNVRWMAIGDLRDIGPDAKAAVPALTAMIHDPGFGVRDNVAEALERISPEAAKAAVPALMDLLKDKDASVQTRTARVLFRLGPEAKSAVVPALLKMLKGDLEQRARAAQLLGEIGPDALGASAVKEVVPAARQLLHEIHEHGNWCYRLHTAEALLTLDPESKPVAISALIELLNHSYGGARWSTANTLGKIGPDAKAAVPALNELLKDRQEHVQKAAKEALDKIQGDKG